MANANKVNRDVMLLNVRLRNCNMAQPYQGKNDRGEVTLNYGLLALFDPNTQAHNEVKKAINEIAIEKWGAQAGAYIQEMMAGDKLCLHDGATKASKPEFAGKWFVSASRYRSPPQASVTRNGANVVIDKTDTCYPYAGCWAHVKLNIWPQEPKGQWPRRINAEVTAVHFVRHDEAFSGGGAGSIVNPEEFPQVETAGADAAPPAASGNGLL